MRIIVQAFGRRRDPDHAQGLFGSLQQGTRGFAVVDANGLNQLIPDGEHRVQRGLWVLEDHGDFAPAHMAHLLVALLQQIFTVEPNLPLDNARRRLGNQS
jgi:hypothetical protein